MQGFKLYQTAALLVGLAEPDCRWPTHATSKPYLCGDLLFYSYLMSSVMLWGGADITV